MSGHGLSRSLYKHSYATWLDGFDVLARLVRVSLSTRPMIWRNSSTGRLGGRSVMLLDMSRRCLPARVETSVYSVGDLRGADDRTRLSVAIYKICAVLPNAELCQTVI